MGGFRKLPRGGARRGAGRKKGFDALRQHERIREMVAAAQDAMVDAQIAAAIGIKYLVARDKKGGKLKHLTEAEAKAILNGQDTERYIVEQWEKPPSTRAFADLTDRVLGKAKDIVDANVGGKLENSWRDSTPERAEAILEAGRKRVRDARRT